MGFNSAFEGLKNVNQISIFPVSNQEASVNIERLTLISILTPVIDLNF